MLERAQNARKRATILGGRVSFTNPAAAMSMAAALIACQERDESAQALAAFEAYAKVVNTEEASAPLDGFNPRLLRRFAPSRSAIPSSENSLAEDRVALGRMLYFEKRISKSQSISCNSCHALDRYGVDGAPTSKGHRSAHGRRNAPTVYHAAAQFRQFWDGRAGSVEEQALGPILNPIEMAAPSEKYVLDVLSSMPEYRKAFELSFPEDKNPITFNNVGKAIGAFERKLITHSRWDDYLVGKKDALSAAEVEGLKLFTNLGCMVCHTGELLGGSMYAGAGEVEPWPNQTDQGRYEITNNDSDRMTFKVPTLRNIAETAPYFHDGSVKSLPEAIRMMGSTQLGLELREEQVRAIATWLKSLTGALPHDYIQPPKLPAHTPETPRADPT